MSDAFKALMPGCLLLVFSVTAIAEDAANKSEQGEKKRNRDECVFFSSVYDWQALDDNSLVIWAPRKNDAYLVELSMPLMGMRSAHTLAFIDGNQDRMLCSFGRDAIGTDDSGMAAKSSIRFISKLDADGIAKLQEKHKVNLSRDKRKKKIPAEPSRDTAK
jgi:hypothetical protein